MLHSTKNPLIFGLLLQELDIYGRENGGDPGLLFSRFIQLKK